MSEYRNAKGLNYSWLKNFAKSPAHTKIEFHGNEATMLGTAFETLVYSIALWDEKFDSEYIVQTVKFDKRTKAGKEGAAQFAEDAGSKTVLTLDQHELLKTMAANFLQMEFMGFTVQELIE